MFGGTAAIPVRPHHGANTAPPSLQGRRHSSGAAMPILLQITNMSMSTHWQFQIDDLFWKHFTFQGHPLDAETQPEAVCFCICKVPFWRSYLGIGNPTIPSSLNCCITTLLSPPLSNTILSSTAISDRTGMSVSQVTDEVLYTGLRCRSCLNLMSEGGSPLAPPIDT